MNQDFEKLHSICNSEINLINCELNTKSVSIQSCLDNIKYEKHNNVKSNVCSLKIIKVSTWTQIKSIIGGAGMYLCTILSSYQSSDLLDEPSCLDYFGYQAQASMSD